MPEVTLIFGVSLDPSLAALDQPEFAITTDESLWRSLWEEAAMWTRLPCGADRLALAALKELPDPIFTATLMGLVRSLAIFFKCPFNEFFNQTVTKGCTGVIQHDGVLLPST